VLYHDKKQLKAARQAVKFQEDQTKRKIITEVKSFKKFWPAEGFHQNWFNKNSEDKGSAEIIKQNLESI
jgi:peptide-methionine (S)-S-oxide reductase